VLLRSPSAFLLVKLNQPEHWTHVNHLPVHRLLRSGGTVGTAIGLIYKPS